MASQKILKKQLNDELNKVFDSSWQWVYDMEDEPRWVANKEEWQEYLTETEEQGYSLKVIFLTITDDDYLWCNSAD